MQEQPMPRPPDNSLEQHYQRLWQQAHELHQHHDPCAFGQHVCASGLEDGCCLCEHHRAGQPCHRRSLGCKLHVCQRVREQHPGLAAGLDQIAQQAARLGLLLEVFSTLE